MNLPDLIDRAERFADAKPRRKLKARTQKRPAGVRRIDPNAPILAQIRKLPR